MIKVIPAMQHTPWLGAQVAPQRCPILRPGRYSIHALHPITTGKAHKRGETIIRADNVKTSYTLSQRQSSTQSRHQRPQEV